MLSSSGTEEESGESDDNCEANKRVKGESLKKLTASKFKPMGTGAEESNSPRFLEATGEELDTETAEHAELKSESHAEASEKRVEKSGIAAAGFKQFVKKSISIKIKGSESVEGSEMNVTAEQTRLLKENKHISKKRSANQNFEVVDAKTNEQKAKESRKFIDKYSGCL